MPAANKRAKTDQADRNETKMSDGEKLNLERGRERKKKYPEHSHFLLLLPSTAEQRFCSVLP